MLTQLPPDVMIEVMRQTGQEDRIACMTASKALSHAALLPAVWDSVTFRELDRSALNFLMGHPCPHVRIESCRPDDVAWFLATLADMGHGTVMRSLVIELGCVERVPDMLLEEVSRHSELRELSIRAQEIKYGCEAGFAADHQLTKLQRLRVVDDTPEGRQLVVWFRGPKGFGALESVHFEVSMSDVGTCAGFMPQLRTLVYRFEPYGGEELDDLLLAGCCFDLVELDVDANTHCRRLFKQLARASVQHLVLHLNDDHILLDRPMSPDMHTLTLDVCSDAVDIEIDFQTLQEQHPRLGTLRVQLGGVLLGGDAMDAEHTLVFRHVPAVRDWLRFFTRVRLETTPSTRVMISPV